MEQLKKTSAQILLFYLLLHLEKYSLVLNKMLNESHLPKETTLNQLEKMAKHNFESNTITFTDDALPTAELDTNRALLLMVKYEGYYVNRIMIDRHISSFYAAKHEI